MKSCPSCYIELPDDVKVKFCTDCGTPLARAEPEIRGELAKKIANQTWDEYFPAPVLRAACTALCSD